MKSISDAMVYLELEPAVKTKLIELGHVSLEELIDAQEEYDRFIAALEQEWPSERLKQHLLAHYRSSCEWALTKRNKLELENRDARVKGVPYSERKKYTVKIEALNSLFRKWRDAGLQVSKFSPRASDYVQSGDYELIQFWGFEKFLRYAIM